MREQAIEQRAELLLLGATQTAKISALRCAISCITLPGGLAPAR